MDLIIPVIVLLIVAIALNKYVKKYFTILCIIAIVLSIFTYFGQDMRSNILSGHMGFAFFVIVMFQSAFKKGSFIHKKTLSVRKEYSILGFIFILPHSLIFLIGEYQLLEWNGIISAVIMIPLFITSFIVIRKKISPQQWINLHLLSYPVYILIFAHIIMISLNVNKIVYTILLVLYLTLKIKNNAFIKLNTTYKKSITIVILLLTLSINSYVYIVNNSFADFKGNQYTDGMYYGEADGYKGLDTRVNIELKNNELVNIEVLSFGGTEPDDHVNFEQAVHTLKNQIIASQTLNLDAISGATRSTTALKRAVKQALNQALIK